MACLSCRDTGLTGAGFCFCEAGKTRHTTTAREAILAGIDENLGIPSRFRGLTFDTYPNQRSEQIQQLRSWVASHDGKRGLFLTGGFGCGKTALLCHTLRQLVAAEAERRILQATQEINSMPFNSDAYRPLTKRVGRFLTVTGLLQSLRPHDSTLHYGGANEDTLRTYQQIPYLAVDDLGAERLTAWGADRLFEIINERYNELRPILLSSNLTLNQLAAKWNSQVGDGESGDRIVNRLVGSCDIIEFPPGAPNLRMTQKSRI